MSINLCTFLNEQINATSFGSVNFGVGFLCVFVCCGLFVWFFGVVVWLFVFFIFLEEGFIVVWFFPRIEQVIQDLLVLV